MPKIQLIFIELFDSITLDARFQRLPEMKMRGIIDTKIVGVITYFPIESAYIKGIKKYVDLIEIRGDIIQHDDVIDKAISKLSGIKPIVLTIRSEDEGGRPIFETDRKELYLRFMEKSDFIDIELSHVDELWEVMKTAESKRKKVIISYHNFDRTPSERELNKIFSRFMKTGGDILKIATFGRSRGDIVNLSLFARKIWLHKITRRIRGLELCVMCMGDPTISFLSRIVLPVFGSDYVYGKVGRSEGSAPGQPDAFELSKILKGL